MHTHTHARARVSMHTHARNCKENARLPEKCRDLHRQQKINYHKTSEKNKAQTPFFRQSLHFSSFLSKFSKRGERLLLCLWLLSAHGNGHQRSKECRCISEGKQTEKIVAIIMMWTDYVLRWLGTVVTSHTASNRQAYTPVMSMLQKLYKVLTAPRAINQHTLMPKCCTQ